VGGGFFTLANTGEADRLVAASTDVADKVEIQQIKVVGPDIRMRPVEKGLAFPAGTTITLKPRGYHLLMTGLKAPLVVGKKVPVTLTFEKAGTRAIELVVEAPGLVGDAALDESLQPK
jgi:copper(I)-binding protein